MDVTRKTIKAGDKLVFGNRWIQVVYVKDSGRVAIDVSCPEHVRVVKPEVNGNNELTIK